MSRLLCVVLFSLLSSNSFADAVLYRMDVEIGSAINVTIRPPGDPLYPCNDVDCNIVGHHVGFFSLDRSVLAHEGQVATVPLSFFFEIGGTVWDSSHPSDFAGFREFCPTANTCSPTGWTVQVHNGELTGICCGVFGGGDFPFMDIHAGPLGNGILIEAGGPLFTPHGTVLRPFLNPVGASFTFAQVPEPPPYALLVLALGLLAMRFRIR